jgi:uncharacterized membrane protein YgcG
MALLAYDGESWGGSNVLFTVTEVDDSPVLADPGAQSAVVGTPFSVILTATDEEGDSINFTLQTDSPAVILTQLTAFTANLSFPSGTPTSGDLGVFSVNITAYQNSTPSLNSTVTFNLTVTEPNEAPVFTSIPNGTETQGNAFVYIINANDSNSGDTLNFTITPLSCALTNPWSINTTDGSPANASGIINVTLTNSHVACRDVTITVSDYNGLGILLSSVSTNVSFNLTNTNDAPEISEMSHYANYLSQDNASNLTAAVGLAFTYYVNASDPDALTYEGDTITYADNSSLFVINTTTGRISFTPLLADVGVHLINLTVTDANALTAERTMTLTIIDNTEPSIVAPGILVCQEDSVCTYNVTAFDPNADENITFTVNDSITGSFTQVTANISSFSATFTNEQVGNYSITLTATDRYGASNTSSFTLIVNNTNDAPFFDSNQDNVSNALTLSAPVVAGAQKTWNVYIYDPDFRTVAENVSFSVNMTGPNASLFTITKTAYNLGVITFTPSSGDIGSYNLTVNLTDLEGASTTQDLTFAVIAAGLDPEITAVQPFTTGTVQTNTSLTATTDTSTTASFSENQSIYFNISLTDGDTVDASVSVDYYWNGDLKYSTTGANPNWTYIPDFFSAGTNTAFVVIEDDTLGNDTFTWNLTIANVKRAPILLSTLRNRTMNGSTTLANEMTFIDPDDDLNSNNLLDGSETNTLVFTPSSLAYFTLTYDEQDVTILPTASGIITFAYTATTALGEYSLDSNDVTYTVFFTEDESSSSSSSSSSGGGGGGGGGGGSAFVPRPEYIPDPYAIDILVPKPLTVYENGTVIAPITIRNTGETSLRDIQLAAFTEANVTMQFLADSISELAPGSMFNTSLAIKGYRFAGTFEVVVTAEVAEPEFNDSAVFFLNSLEKGSFGDAVNTKITSARDLLTQNPVCGELTQLVEQAGAAYARGETERAEELLTAATDGCAYLKAIQLQELENPTLLTGLLGKRSTNIVLGGAFLALLVIGSMLVAHYARQE